MPATWCDAQYCRNALIPYDDVQITDAEFTPAIPKAQGWVSAFVSPVIASQANSMTSLSDSAPIKLCVALYACFFVCRKRFQQRGPNQNPWVNELREDANKLLELIKNNPSKALGGTTISQTQAGTMGLQSSTENYYPTGTLLSETETAIDPERLEDEADERGISPL